MLGFLRSIFQNRGLLLELTKNEIVQRYLGSSLGMLWAVIQPAATVMVFWFVFQVGFKSQPVDGFPFILWLIAGMFPWFFIAEAASNGTNSILANSFLVKKIVFRVSLLPMVPLLAALAVHVILVIFMCILFLLYGYSPNIYWMQLIYYILACSVMLLGLSWITSSIVVFFKDIGQMVSILIQFGFWLTPIFWSLNMVPEKYHFIIRLNPFVYIIDGYRDSMIYHKWFWQEPGFTIYFWIITGVVFVSGGMIFKRLRPHFADVL